MGSRGCMPIDAATRFELLDTYARYGHSYDDGDFEQWAACFTVDGVLWTSRGLEVRGRQGLQEFARSRTAGIRTPERHLSWHHLFTPTDGGVQGRCSAGIVRTTTEGVGFVFVATYRDRLVFDDGLWRLALREVHFDTP